MAVKLSVLKRWVNLFVPMFEGDEDLKRTMEEVLKNAKKEGNYKIVLVSDNVSLKDALASIPSYSAEEKRFLEYISSYIKRYKLFLEENGKIKFHIARKGYNGGEYVYLAADTKLGKDAKMDFTSYLSIQSMAKLLMNEGITISETDFSNILDSFNYIYVETDV